MNEIGNAVKEALFLVHCQGKVAVSQLRSTNARRAIHLLKRARILKEPQLGVYTLPANLAQKPLEELLSTCEARIRKSRALLRIFVRLANR